jgi:vesicular inhibitory amino acid transporter
MALIGSSLCFTICVILPLAFYLKIFGTEISVEERIVDCVLLVISSIIAVVGTIWVILPQEKLG